MCVYLYLIYIHLGVCTCPRRVRLRTSFALLLSVGFLSMGEDPLDCLSSRFSINWVAVVDNIELPLESFDAANELVVIVIARVIYMKGV